MAQNSEKFNFWVQLSTSIAVIVGLALVVWELQMTRTVWSDQYALQNISDASSDLSAVYGENAADILAKACFKPSSLSDAELIVLSHYFSNRINRIYSIRWQARFSDYDDWEAPASYFLSTILMYPQGSAFLEGYQFSEDNKDIADFVEKYVKSATKETCDKSIDRLRVGPHDDA